MRRIRKAANLQRKDDLSFMPPMAEQVQYIELADRFLGEDSETRAAPAPDRGHRSNRKAVSSPQEKKQS